MEGTSIGAKEMKVLRFVHHPKLSYDQLLEAHIKRLSTLIGDKYNEGQQLRIYADISEKGFKSQTAVILDGMEAAYRATGNKGVWIADRGYDNKKVLDCLLDRKTVFVIRVRIDPKVSREIRDEKGRKKRLSTVAWNTRIKYNLSDYGGRGKIKFGFSKPITLTNLKVETVQDVAQVVEHYMSRWSGCEDPIRFLKQAFRIEKFLIDGMVAIRVWFFFISVAFSILFEIESWGKILEWTIKLSQLFAKDV
jgi:hypothetical protein